MEAYDVSDCSIWILEDVADISISLDLWRKDIYEIASVECTKVKGQLLICNLPEDIWTEHNGESCIVVKTKPDINLYFYKSGSMEECHIKEDGTEETTLTSGTSGDRAGVDDNGNLSKLKNWPFLRNWLEEKEES